jgi:hypothetical protein
MVLLGRPGGRVGRCRDFSFQQSEEQDIMITNPSKNTQRSNRWVPLIWGIISLITIIVILVRFSGWWTYIVGGLLLAFAWVSLKTAIFASQKEIKELTEPGPVSEKTKRKYLNRL